jgi:hypothetical protein
MKSSQVPKSMGLLLTALSATACAQSPAGPVMHRSAMMILLLSSSICLTMKYNLKSVRNFLYFEYAPLNPSGRGTLIPLELDDELEVVVVVGLGGLGVGEGVRDDSAILLILIGDAGCVDDGEEVVRGSSVCSGLGITIVGSLGTEILMKGLEVLLFLVGYGSPGRGVS